LSQFQDKLQLVVGFEPASSEWQPGYCPP